MFEVIDDHTTDCSFDKVLVLEALPFFELHAQNNLVGPQESYRAFLNLLKPS